MSWNQLLAKMADAMANFRPANPARLTHAELREVEDVILHDVLRPALAEALVDETPTTFGGRERRAVPR